MKLVHYIWSIALSALLSCGEPSSEPPSTRLSPTESALQSDRTLECMKLGVASMKQWLKDRRDEADEPIQEVQDRMLLAVSRHVETLPGPERAAQAARLMQFMDQQTNLGFDLYQSGSAGIRIAAHYAKLRGRLCQLMGNRPRAIAEYESCLDVLKLDDSQARLWRRQVEENR